jgi:hypothetical protein
MSAEHIEAESGSGHTVICDGKLVTIRSGRRGQHETKISISRIASISISRTLMGGYIHFRADGDNYQIHFSRSRKADFERLLSVIEAAMAAS